MVELDNNLTISLNFGIFVKLREYSTNFKRVYINFSLKNLIYSPVQFNSQLL